MSKRKERNRSTKRLPQIDATPEQLMRILVQTPPKEPDEWRYSSKRDGSSRRNK